MWCLCWIAGRIYAYEVDGLGNSLLMDDANVPSLMSVPYLGYPYDPEVYDNTRRFILSPDNPTFAKSRDGPSEAPALSREGRALFAIRTIVRGGTASMLPQAASRATGRRT